MKIDIEKTDRLFIDHGSAVRDVLEQAVIEALIEHKRAGNPIASWEEGRVVILQPDEIRIPELKRSNGAG
ncbi:MAG TPA: hypothetical protein VHI13_01540 [Candidatus Kapabacteria bacterium]|nr:hypothetical protein [Candidatus Kapabacteria bacterium]